MIAIAKLVHDKQAMMFFSFLIGFGVSIFISNKKPGMIPSLALPLKELEGRIVKYEDKCYSYHAEDAKCDGLNKHG